MLSGDGPRAKRAALIWSKQSSHLKTPRGKEREFFFSPPFPWSAFYVYVRFVYAMQINCQVAMLKRQGIRSELVQCCRVPALERNMTGARPLLFAEDLITKKLPWQFLYKSFILFNKKRHSLPLSLLAFFCKPLQPCIIVFTVPLNKIWIIF